ncbi:MAG: HPP family protein [Deltaproteobacteria bacterium]|nr:HPP family protein [Deltaproteobacteria bacterium]
MDYFKKMAGGAKCPPRVSISEIFWSWVGAFLGISAVCYLHYDFAAKVDMILIVASFGASAVLIYGAPKVPLAQPRNLMGGHVLSALVGVACFKLLGTEPWLAGGVAVATAIALMHYTRTLHPPAGATALIAVVGGEKIHALGFFYALMPVAAGAFIMLVVAVLVNNLAKDRRYPEYWF